MKNFNNTGRKKGIDEFTPHSLEQALFYATPPTVSTTPFDAYRHLSHLQVKMSITLPQKSVPAEEILTAATGFNCRNLPMWSNEVLLKCYQEWQQAWKDFLVAGLEEFCKTSGVSHIMWASVSSGHAPVVGDSLEYLLWIHACKRLELENKQRFLVTLTESLHPWLNEKLYHQVESRKKNRHENTDYESQRQLMEAEARRYIHG